MASLQELSQRAQRGERLRVVFLGGSLTYGANASAPELTSYRALVARRLEGAFPRTQFRVWDAAIGNTGSQLAVFRLERDVLRHEPDLVFLDFTVNDDIRADDTERLASYESLLRRLINNGAAVVAVILPFRDEIEDRGVDLPRRAAHLALASAYQLPAADVVTAVRRRVDAGEFAPADLWPWDGAHPCDHGYAVFADAVWETVAAALRENKHAIVPAASLHGGGYAHWLRARLCDVAEGLPSGWRREMPSRTAAWYDGLTTRWLDSIAAAHRAEHPQPLKLLIEGGMIALFGEETVASGGYSVSIDGRDVSVNGEPMVNVSSRAFGGNRQHFRVVATGLAEGITHDVVITPRFPGNDSTELRIESVCVAGSRPVRVRVDA